jgi:hypothetical protein
VRKHFLTSSFYEHLRNRGYPTNAIDSSFHEVNWNQRRTLLEPKVKAKRAGADAFFLEYRGCVFSNRNAPGNNELRRDLNLSLEELRQQGAGRDIFPRRAFFAVWSALPLGYTLRR